MTEERSYYVYVYIDPRNYEEFYYGKGTGTRMFAHLEDGGESSKVRRIKDIHREGLEPIIRVVARDLTEDQALLVEKTLIWRLGKGLENIASGHFAQKFRPHNTMHRKLAGFDYSNGVFFFNVGEEPGWIRSWDRCREHGFLCAGHGVKYQDAVRGLRTGDVVCAYLNRHGYVGIGRVVAEAKPVRSVLIGQTPLLTLCPDEGLDAHDDQKTEWACLVKWIKCVPASGAKWRPRSGLFTTQLVRASLENQRPTIAFLESEFGIADLFALAGQRLGPSGGETLVGDAAMGSEGDCT